MPYYVYCDEVSGSAKVHHDECHHAHGRTGDPGWYGPYDSLQEAESKWEEFVAAQKYCHVCVNE